MQPMEFESGEEIIESQILKHFAKKDVHVHFGTTSHIDAHSETEKTMLNIPIWPSWVSISSTHLSAPLPKISSSFGPIDSTLPEFDILVDASVNLFRDIVWPFIEFVFMSQSVETLIFIMFESVLRIGKFPFVSSVFNIRNVQSIIFFSSQNLYCCVERDWVTSGNLWKPRDLRLALWTRLKCHHFVIIVNKYIVEPP